jgi:hypothetical protein
MLHAVLGAARSGHAGELRHLVLAMRGQGSGELVRDVSQPLKVAAPLPDARDFERNAEDRLVTCVELGSIDLVAVAPGDQACVASPASSRWTSCSAGRLEQAIRIRNCQMGTIGAAAKQPTLRRHQ